MRANGPRASALCRDCDRWWSEVAERPARCPSCGSARTLAHPELRALTIAHVDCDAFYASVEKRDRPELAHRPVIVGGGRRGVVTTACYLARIHGVRSAMPMFEARRLCPKAVVLKPDIAKYVAASRAIREILLSATPSVEPLSLDEAFLDLSGAERLHGAPAAVTLARLARRVEAECGVTLSIGLAPNKFLAKTASEMDKPRGYAVIGAVEAEALLAPRPVGALWGVGAAGAARLERDGYARVGDLARADPTRLARRYGAWGLRLHALALGRDDRRVSPDSRPKSVSSETTFARDLSPGHAADAEALDARLWRLCERVADRLKAKALAGRTVTVKLKTARFRVVTKRRSRPEPIGMADPLYRVAAPLAAAAAAALGPTASLRLLGVGVSDLATADPTAPTATDLLDPDAPKRAEAERAVDRIRARFGPDAIGKGRALD